MKNKNKKSAVKDTLFGGLMILIAGVIWLVIAMLAYDGMISIFNVQQEKEWMFIIVLVIIAPISFLADAGLLFAGIEISIFFENFIRKIRKN